MAAGNPAAVMSNFLLRDPDCVFIHIPKTGGSSIRRGLWDGRYEPAQFGPLPLEWREYFSFAFVRHPLDRLVSAFCDFTQLRAYKGDFRSFLDKVVDESVIYDERRKTAAERIRHHTLPQTHPFHALDEADFVGRYETYGRDVQIVLRRVGMEPALPPALRKTEHDGWRGFFDEETLEIALEYYAEDFYALEYPSPHDPV